MGGEEEFDWDGAETKPLISATATERGQDYWVDQEEATKFAIREEALKNRKSMEGEISKEKLKEEIAAPYKGNWIGVFSLFIGIISAIAIKFPQLLENPIITIPDL